MVAETYLVTRVTRLNSRNDSKGKVNIYINITYYYQPGSERIEQQKLK